MNRRASKQETAAVHTQLAPVRRYREWLATFGKDHVLIQIPAGSPAHFLGYRYGTCERAQLADYLAGGAVLVEGETA